VREAVFQCPARPHVGIVEAAKMLMCARQVSVREDERVRCVGTRRRFGTRGEQIDRPLAELDGPSMVALQMMEPSLHQQSVRGFDGMLIRIEHRARLLQVREPALVGHRHERRGRLALQPGADDGIGGVPEGALEVLQRRQRVAGELADAPHFLLNGELLIAAPERLGTFQRAAVSGNGLVIGEHPLRLGSGLARKG
jgi:hypothetical protein